MAEAIAGAAILGAVGSAATNSGSKIWRWAKRKFNGDSGNNDDGNSVGQTFNAGGQHIDGDHGTGRDRNTRNILNIFGHQSVTEVRGFIPTSEPSVPFDVVTNVGGVLISLTIVCQILLLAQELRSYRKLGRNDYPFVFCFIAILAPALCAFLPAEFRAKYLICIIFSFVAMIAEYFVWYQLCKEIGQHDLEYFTCVDNCDENGQCKYYGIQGFDNHRLAEQCKNYTCHDLKECDKVYHCFCAITGETVASAMEYICFKGDNGEKCKDYSEVSKILHLSSVMAFVNATLILLFGSACTYNLIQLVKRRGYVQLPEHSI